MSNLDRHHEQQEIDADKRSAEITEEYNTICADVGLVEEVIELYKSDIANSWVLSHGNVLSEAHGLWKEMNNCILLEAELNVDNRRS